MMGAEAIIERLGLAPHPEGGRFRETWRDDAGTAIYFLLQAGELSHWHRVAHAEIWHFYAGAPLELRIGRERHALGPDLLSGERPQIVVPAGAWQSAASLGDWTLVGCTVAPPFTYEDFELAPPDFAP